MRCVVTGAVSGSFKDDQTNQTVAYGRCHGFKCRALAAKTGERSAGFEAFDIKADSQVADELVSQLQRSGGAPLVCDLETEVTGKGQYLKQVAIDAKPLGVYGRDFVINSDGLREVERPRAVRKENGEVGAVGAGASRGVPAMAGAGA